MELLAPNKKPSNLNQEQWLLVRTPEFKAWFGDWEKLALTKLYDSGIDEISLKKLEDTVSKVVDENGEPLVCYHSTKNNFTEFNKKRGSNHYGIYFSANEQSTRTYGHLTKEYFLKIVNPEIPKFWFHSVIDESMFNRMIKNNFDGAFWSRKKYNSDKFELYEILVFEPNQIKLADGTNTTFDSNNPDIRFEEGGNVLESLFNNIEDVIPIKINGKIVGGIDVTTYRGDTETLRVHKMLILPEFQGKGLGAKAIKKLFRENPNVKQIIGNATAESKPFWQKIGAEFHSNEHTAFTITRNADVRFEDGGEITNYSEFYDNLKIEDGSIYIGQKFGDIFPFLKRRGKRPNNYRNIVNQYYGILDRLRKDNFSSPIQKKRDLNKLDRIRNIEKKKYLAKFYLDGIGTIIDFRASNYDDKNDDIRFEDGGLIDDGTENFGKIKDFDKRVFLHETNLENFKNIIKNGFLIQENPVITKGIYTIPEQWKENQFNKNNREIKIKLKKGKRIFWTDSDRPMDYYTGYGNKFFQELYKELNKGEISPREAVNLSSEEWHTSKQNFCRRMEKWLQENNYAGIQQGGEIVITDRNSYNVINADIRFENGGLTEIEQWKLEQAQNDQQSFEILQDYFGFELPENADTYEYKNGGKVSKTPAPKSEQIYGSKVNKQDSSSDIKKAKNIKFDEKTLLSINEKVKEHNKQYPNKKINLASAKAVVRRGMGAYSSSHRPTITGGKPNSRVAWGLARLNAFIYKIINGKSKSGRYTQDDDLIKELNIMVKSYKDGGEIPKANKMFHLPIELTVYVPSTQDVDKVVSKKEMNDRVNEVKNYLGRTFGGFSASDVQGGFVASDGNIVNEDIIKVVSFAQKEDYEKNKEELVKKITEWAEKWGQEAIGLEYEGDLYYVPEKLKKGGSIKNSEPKLNRKESYWEGWGFSDRIKVVLKGDKKNIIQGYKDLQVAFPEDQKEIIQELTIEIFVNEKDLKKVKKIANYNNLALMYEDGGEIDYSTGWNQDYENDPLVKAKRKAKELATRAALAYATAGTSEVARAEGQAIQQGLSTIKPQQTTEQPNTQSNQPQQNNQFQQLLNNPELQKMAISALSKGKMAEGGNIESAFSELSINQIPIASNTEIKNDTTIYKYYSDLSATGKFYEIEDKIFDTLFKAKEYANKKNYPIEIVELNYGSVYGQGGTTPGQEKKIEKVMKEFKSGKLHSGSKKGPIVKNRKQAIAIALSEAGLSKK